MDSPKITKDLLDFLKQLKANNNREWFTEHKSDFKKHEKAFKSFCKSLQERMQKHDEIENHKVFRIYRDVRFSTDKTPYKPHFSCAFTRRGDALRGGYYLHIQPGESFIATGFWAPEKEDLFRIRKEWEMDARPLYKIIQKPVFKEVWGELKGDSLKSAPRGFDKSHPEIDLIRKKQFIFTREFKENQVLDTNFIQEVDRSFNAVRPYFDLMSDVLTTNLNGESLLD